MDLSALMAALPGEVKGTILDMVVTGSNKPNTSLACSTQDTTPTEHPLFFPPTPMLSTPGGIEDVLSVVERLAEEGYCVVEPQFLGSDAEGLVDAARDVVALAEGGEVELTQGKMSGGKLAYADHTKRSDSTSFVGDRQVRDASGLGGALERYLGNVQGLVDAVNSVTGLGLVREKAMLAAYSEGGRYVAHQDASPLIPGRVLTCILYANAGWEESHGGELRLCGPDITVQPTAGTVLLFDARMEHEVLPTTAPSRTALTIWLRIPDVLPSQFDATHARLVESLARGSKLGREVWIAPSICVFIASFRDSELKHTLASLFAEAAYPDRVYVGLILQVEEGDEPECGIGAEDVDPESPLGVWLASHVRVVRSPAREARGPCPARARLPEVYGGEDFVFQTDSHMRFVAGWDTVLLDAEHRAVRDKGSATPVIVAYPLAYQRPHDLIIDPDKGLGPVLLYADAFDEDGMVRIAGRQARAQRTRGHDLVEQRFWCAGASFSRASVLLTLVPYDPSLVDLFFGEEMVMTARMWTSGVDFYAPPISVCFHLWDRSYRPPWLSTTDRDGRKGSQSRVQTLLSVGGEGGEGGGGYELGEERGLEAFYRFVGVDFESRTIT